MESGITGRYPMPEPKVKCADCQWRKLDTPIISTHTCSGIHPIHKKHICIAFEKKLKSKPKRKSSYLTSKKEL